MGEKPPGKLSDFTGPECEYFRRNCNFTDEEMAVFDLRIRNKSNTQICFALGMSESTVTRRVRSIKRKIYKVL